MLNFDWLSGIPMGAAKSVFLVLFVLIGIAVSFVPKQYMYEGLTTVRWYHNLKIWSYGVLLLIGFVYYIF